MLGDRDATATVAVKDLEAARRFYEDKLGLAPVHAEEGHGVVTYRTGGSSLLVYASQSAGTNRAMAVTWSVGAHFDDILQSLQAKGVSFERYDDLPQVTRDGDVHRVGDLKLAWFKDPDGNIHHLISA
ncbi:MAG TPA: VOC family protein [Thermoanaerobaculia bacterium]|jgi:catechol 2,3-dioxygenase-like lactoylglutathione lyase family enzyme|nr:VOC family protein [Thermoanaerobaculia bacterium]